MPFKSDKQRKYLYSQKPEVAKKFAADGEKSRKRAKAIRSATGGGGAIGSAVGGAG